MNKILSKYIIKEFSVPFAITLAVLTMTLLLGKVIRIIEIAVYNDIGVSFVFNFLINAVPTVLNYILPSTFLIALLITITRLSSDNEIIAFKSSGIDLNQFLKPVLLFGFIIFLFSVSLSTYLSPLGNKNIKKILFNVAQEKTIAGLEERKFYSQFENLTLYIESIDKSSGTLKGIFIEQTSEDNSKILIFANRGNISSSKETLSIILTLIDGHIFRDETASTHSAEFNEYAMNLAFIEKNSINSHRKPSRELFNSELKEKINHYKERTNNRGNWRKLTIDLYDRYAQPASIFAFCLLGITLGIQKVRSAKLTGFSMSLTVLVLYYAFGKTFESLGDNAIISPLVAVIMPTLILFIIGLVLYIMARKEHTIDVGQIYDNIKEFIITKLSR